MTDNFNYPTVMISASINAPEIEARQWGFASENPDLLMLTVESMRNRLKGLTDELTGSEEIQRGFGSVSLSNKDDIEGVSLTLTIELTNVQDATEISVALTKTVWGMMLMMANDLTADPLGEHRRGHIQELKELEVDPDVIRLLETAPIGILCQFSAMEQLKARGPLFADEPPAASLWKQVKDFFLS